MNEPMGLKRVLSLALSQEDAETLDALCDELEMSQSAILRQALKNFADDMEINAKPRGKK